MTTRKMVGELSSLTSLMSGPIMIRAQWLGLVNTSNYDKMVMVIEKNLNIMSTEALCEFCRAYSIQDGNQPSTVERTIKAVVHEMMFFVMQNNPIAEAAVTNLVRGMHGHVQRSVFSFASSFLSPQEWGTVKSARVTFNQPSNGLFTLTASS